MPELLPDTRILKNVVSWPNGMRWVPIFCANCGADGGLVPEENCNFAFYLCDPCAIKWSPLVDTLMVPDAVFWEKVKQAQLEKYGRELSGPEIVEALKDSNHVLYKLSKDRGNF